MDISQAAFGLDMREASRIYFINPVLNPQIEAQAIGRVRRISQKKAVSVETLVLKNSIDEIILERKQHMTQAEHRQVKSILSVGAIYDWIKNVRVNPMPEAKEDYLSQMVMLHTPQRVFGRGFGRALHPDDGLVLNESLALRNAAHTQPLSWSTVVGIKRRHEVGLLTEQNGIDAARKEDDMEPRPARRVRFAGGSDED